MAVSLFLIAMESLFKVLPKDVLIFVYADDIVLVVVGNNATRVRIKLQAAIRAVARWANSTGFQMAAEKCSISHICNHRHNPWSREVTVDNIRIPYRKVTKILGVYFDRHLSFNHHFEQLKTNLKQRSCLVRTISRCQSTSNRKTIMNIGNSLILSKNNMQATCRNTEQFKKSLSPFYNKMVREASGLLPSSPTKSSCVEAGLLPFDSLLAKVVATRATSYAEKAKHKSPQCLLSTVANNLFKNLTRSRLPKVLQLIRMSDRIWNMPSHRIDWGLKHKLSTKDSPLKVQATLNFMQMVLSSETM